MKIKHWQGYGCVNAKKISKAKSGQNVRLVVEVSGNHECGLIRNDVYGVHKWLLSRFAKDCAAPGDVLNMQIVSDESGDVDVARYEFTYRPSSD